MKRAEEPPEDEEENSNSADAESTQLLQQERTGKRQRLEIPDNDIVR